MWNPFKKKEPAKPPGAGVGYGSYDNTTIAAGVESPGRYPNITAHGSGLDGWAARVGVNLPAKLNQDNLLIHRPGPPPDDPVKDTGGTPYYHARNSWKIDRDWPLENLQAKNWMEDSRSYSRRDPKETPVAPSRATSFQSPSNYRFLAPMRSGNGDVRHLNGVHFSMASQHRNYPIRGMRPTPTWRNTYRLEPDARDSNFIDMPAGENAAPQTVYNSPNFAAAPNRGKTWRLT